MVKDVFLILQIVLLIRALKRIVRNLRDSMERMRMEQIYINFVGILLLQRLLTLVK